MMRSSMLTSYKSRRASQDRSRACWCATISSLPQVICLVEIDRADPESRLSQVTSQRVEAQTQLAQANAQLPASEAAYAGAQANASAARAQAAKALRDLERYQSLHQANPKAVSQTQLDQIVTAADNAKAQRDAAAEQARSAAAQVDVTRVQITGAEARLKTLQAQVEEAQLNRRLHAHHRTLCRTRDPKVSCPRQLRARPGRR